MHRLAEDLLQYMNSVKELYLSHNKLQVVPRLMPHSHASKLTFIHLEENQVESIDPSVYSLANLVEASVQKNAMNLLRHIAQHVRLCLSVYRPRKSPNLLREGKYSHIMSQ